MSESNIQEWIDRMRFHMEDLRNDIHAVLEAKDKRIEAQKIVISELLLEPNCYSLNTRTTTLPANRL